MNRLALIAALAAGLLSAVPTFACTPVVTTGPEATPGSSPEQVLRHGQTEWRRQSDVVFVAQLREGRMVGNGEVEFTLVPVATVYGGDLPEAMLLYRWTPGNSCNRFALNLTDLVVVFADVDQIGWGIVGMVVPDQLQDQPANFRRTLRDIHRGIIPGPALPE